jgi:hypothetical protein
MRKLIAGAVLGVLLLGAAPALAGAVCVNHEMNCFGVPFVNAKINLLTVEGGRDSGPGIRTTGVALTAKPDDIKATPCVNGQCSTDRYEVTIDYGQLVIRVYRPGSCMQFSDHDLGGPCHNP